MNQPLPPLPYGRHSISDADVAAVVEVLRSDWLTQGPAVPAFEQAVARYCHSAHTVAVNSATSALHIACLALGVGAGDRVWTSPNTFVASANCALYCGASVDFVDIDPLTANLCPHRLQRKLEAAQATGELPKVVIAVHFAGQSCDMAAIHALSRQYGFRIIEDASHAIGARHLGEPVGSCRYSDIAIFSFHPVKIITSAEGGMALCNDAALARRMQVLRSHGITREADEFALPAPGPWHYEQQSLGFNYRMTDLQAALGLSQLARLDSFVAQRNALADTYHALLQDLPLALPHVAAHNLSSYHLYTVRLDQARAPLGQAELMAALRERGLLVNLHYTPVHLQPYYRAMGFEPGDFPAAEAHARTAVSLPLFPDMAPQDPQRVAQALRALLAPSHPQRAAQSSAALCD